MEFTASPILLCGMLFVGQALLLLGDYIYGVNTPEAIAQKGDRGIRISALIAIPFGIAVIPGSFVFLHLFEPAGSWQGPLTTALLCIFAIAAIAAHAMYAIVVMAKSKMEEDESGVAQSIYERAAKLYIMINSSIVFPSVLLGFGLTALFILLTDTRVPLWTMIVHPIWALPALMYARSKEIQLPVILRLPPLSGVIFTGAVFVSMLM